MIGQREALRLCGCETFDPRGNRIGIVGQLLLDDETEQPAWVTVQAGLFGTNEHFVPLDGAAFDGDTLTVAVSREMVRSAPRVPLEQGDLLLEDERRLHRHYGLLREDAAEAEKSARSSASAGSSAPAGASGGTDYSTVDDGSAVDSPDERPRAEAVRLRLRRWLAAT